MIEKNEIPGSSPTDNGDAMRISREDALFLRILADHVNERATDLNEEEIRNIDWSVVSSRARSQQVSAIVSYQVPRGRLQDGEDTQTSTLPQDVAAQAFLAVNRSKMIKDIDAALTSRGIPYILFKGTEVAQFYPVPELRSMGDSDILVHKHDKMQAHEALISAGLEGEPRGRDEWVYFRGGLEFELHHRLLYDYVTNYEQFKDYCDTAWEHAHSAGNDTSRQVLDWEFHVVYLLLHLRKHMLYSGVGFRQFMDIAVTVRAGLVDWDRVADDLEALGLLEFGQTCLAFCARWFDVSSPLGSREIDEFFYVRATRKIMENGVFGFDDPSNKGNHTLNELHVRKGSTAKVRVAIRGLFPAYENMCEADYYSFVRGRKWLLPAAWAYRFARSAKYGKTSQGLKQAAAPLAMDEKIDAHEQMLSGWGLE